MRYSSREVFLGSRSERGPCCGKRCQFILSVRLVLRLLMRNEE
jgi:hypothetical protein